MEAIPYSRQWIDDADVEAVTSILQADFLTQGPAVDRFEASFNALHEVKHGIAVSSATAGLHIACLAVGVGNGDWVWTSPNSFVASANCAVYCGAKVDFVDIDPATRNMCGVKLAEKLERAAHEGRLPKAVVPVDFAGLPCDLAGMRGLADRYGFSIIEDASHAVGALLDGQPVGSRYADITVFSFHPVKIITTGEGGLCTTQSDELAYRLRLLRTHGITRDPAAMSRASDGPWYYEQVSLGFNYRMTDFQAALGTSQLTRLSALRAAREARTLRYDRLLQDLPLHLPGRPKDRVSAHHLYVIEIDETKTRADRAAVFAALRADQIGVNVHYIPIHLQTYYRNMGFAEGDFPNAEHYYRRAITIPLFPAMTDAQQNRVVDSLAQALG